MGLAGPGDRGISMVPAGAGPVKTTIRSASVALLRDDMNSRCGHARRGIRERLKAFAKDHEVVT